DAKSLVGLCFAKIDIGERGRVDEHIEIYLTELLANLVKIREIELRVIESDDVMFALIFADERRAKPPARADNQNLHLLWNRVMKKAAQPRRTPKSAVRNPQSTINIFRHAQAKAATRMDYQRTTEWFPQALP